MRLIEIEENTKFKLNDMFLTMTEHDIVIIKNIDYSHEHPYSFELLSKNEEYVYFKYCYKFSFEGNLFLSEKNYINIFSFILRPTKKEILNRMNNKIGSFNIITFPSVNQPLKEFNIF